jgi:hypothetical protein
MSEADPMDIKNAYIFYAASAVVIGYIVYMMIRRRKGERVGTGVHEPEL